MGNALQTIQRYDKSPSSWKHIVNCYIHDLQQLLLNKYKESEFQLFTNTSVSIIDIITGYVIYYDIFRWKNYKSLTFNNNRMTITNNNNNEKDIINVFGSYIIHCNDKENINKSFKWTFDIHKCHIIGIGIISVTDSANYHKHTENDAFYSIPNPISYAITNDGSMWSNGTKHIFETLVPFSINNTSNTQNTRISNNDISKSVEQKDKSNETKQSQQSNEHNKFNKKDDTQTEKKYASTQQESAETEIETSNDNTVTSVQHKDQLNETKKTKQTDKNIVNKKGNKKRKKSLIFLNGDLFVMTVTTVFRNLEEERIWDIDQSIRDLFNPKRLYEDSLRKDIPWRQWNVWIRETIVTYLRENGR
eukprot:459916_1